MTDARRGETTLELVGDRALRITRVFRAPPRVVFDAWTRPEVVALWWAPRSRARMVETSADVRVGGHYRYVLRALPGHDFAHAEAPTFAFSGEYLEVTPPTRLRYTHVFEPMAHAGSCTITVRFEPVGEWTRLVSDEEYSSAELRGIVLDTGMEPGMRETMDQLDELVLTRG